MSDPVSRLEMLHFARRVVEQQLAQIDRWIAREERREVERRCGEQARPSAPAWVLELGIGDRRRPVYVHAGDCHMVGKRRRSVHADEVRRALADGVDACPHYRPDTALGVLE